MTAMTISWKRPRRCHDVAVIARWLHHCMISHSVISVVIKPIAVRIAVAWDVVVFAETARVREEAVRRMG
jgi:hypothetical protein